MLSLSRQPGETIVVTTASGERIRFTVAFCRGNRAQIHVNAPKTVRVDREEVDQKRQQGERSF